MKTETGRDRVKKWVKLTPVNKNKNILDLGMVVPKIIETRCSIQTKEEDDRIPCTTPSTITIVACLQPFLLPECCSLFL